MDQIELVLVRVARLDFRLVTEKMVGEKYMESKAPKVVEIMSSTQFTDAKNALTRYRDFRVERVSEGRESPEYAAMLLEAYSKGIGEMLTIMSIESHHMSVVLQQFGIELCLSIDPDFIQHRQERAGCKCVVEKI